MKNITSSDTRKKAVVEALKAASGGNKVTNVKEDETHFHGTCMKYNPAEGKYENLGQFSVSKPKAKK